ncbi:MAG: XTP/dITP diphosphatase [Kiritimatiellia bacterium]|jgi:XTP/dITP diphosphohydrolase|nr:XTP/dITP diphosphatase [Kiritimatiellia bacterium]MDP6848296.1 XTP/dITP diphosphatase [Kiritimatiellia bacterium]
MKLLIATGNAHKLREIRQIFTMPGLEILGMEAFPDAPEVIEDGETFEANAVKKAVTLASVTGLWALADDSGLVVDVLDGAPGVYSARYAGEPVDYAANNSKLLAELADKPDRTARFRCAIALASPDGDVRVVDGSCKGRIGENLKGCEGFGYDPLFIPDGYDQTFAEMPAEEKNAISHRGRALARAESEWADLLG